MKDLFLFAADADSQAFFSSLINRGEALGIRPITMDTDRHPGRDPGMVQSGPELMRMRKGGHRRALFVLDHHGSGRESKWDAAALAQELQTRLDTCSWANNSLVVVLEPEVERWLWHTGAAIASHFGISQQRLREYEDRWCQSHGLDPAQAKESLPKELFEGIVHGYLRRSLSPRDFARLGELASVRALVHEPGFVRLRSRLRDWFPPLDDEEL